MLNVTGKQMNIYKPKTPPIDELLAKQFKPDEWPVTTPMMKEPFKGDQQKPKTFPVLTPRK